MQEYSQIIINALPLMLVQDSKVKAVSTVVMYMDVMLKKAKTEQDLKIFAQTLVQCKDFSIQNKLEGLYQACAEWNHKGIIKLNQIRGISQQNDISIRLHEFLEQTSKEINEAARVDPDEFPVILNKLDQTETVLISTGNQYLSQEQIQAFMQEIINQRERIRAYYSLVDEINEILQR